MKMTKDYRALYEACKQQAQIWKQEARCANHTIGQIYQLVTGRKGEPGNWNGAEPIKALLEQRDDLVEALDALADAVAAEVNEKGGGGYILARLTDARAAVAKAGLRSGLH
jgi:hypothetical protein